MKKEAMDKVMIAIRRVLGGEIYLSDKMASRMVHKLIDRRGHRERIAPGNAFRSRIRGFQPDLAGHRPDGDCPAVVVSVKTIETHREHVKQKLGLKSGTELTRYAVQWAMKQK